MKLVDPAGKWKVRVNKPELEKQLRKFVAEAAVFASFTNKTALEEAVRSSAFERSAWESARAGPAPGATAAEDGPAAG